MSTLAEAGLTERGLADCGLGRERARCLHCVAVDGAVLRFLPSSS
jgi:hypothetical protein